MEGDRVQLRISCIKSVIRFGKNDKFNPSYIDPFEVLERVGEMT